MNKIFKVGYCKHCKLEIKSDEDYKIINSHIYHTECFDNHIEEEGLRLIIGDDEDEL